MNHSLTHSNKKEIMKTSETPTERSYTSDSDAYEIFVGALSPQEFVTGYEEFECPAEEAVKDFLRTWPYEDESPPSWLEDALLGYVQTALDND